MTLDTVFERGLPASVDAERSILGAIMLDNACFYQCADLAGRSFALDSHQRIFARIGEMMDANRAVDIVTLAEELAKRKETESIGGVAYLASLTEGLPRRLSIEEYVEIVRDKWQLRSMIGVCSTAITRAADQSENAADLVAEIDRQLLEIAHTSGTEASLASQTAIAFDELANLRDGKIEPAVSTGAAQPGSHHWRVQAQKAVRGGRPAFDGQNQSDDRSGYPALLPQDPDAPCLTGDDRRGVATPDLRGRLRGSF